MLVLSGAALLRRSAECHSSDRYLGTFLTLAQCQAACAAVPACRFFLFGVGAKAGRCYHEFTMDATCPEGWQADNYTFYERVSWSRLGSAVLRRHAECSSADFKLGEFPGRVDLCAAACARRAGCHYFIFGTGRKAGHCWHEFTHADECPEGWEADEYDFYELEAHDVATDDTRRGSGAPLPPSRLAAVTRERPQVGAFLTGFLSALALMWMILLHARRQITDGHEGWLRAMVMMIPPGPLLRHRRCNNDDEEEAAGRARAREQREEPQRLLAVRDSALGGASFRAEPSDSHRWVAEPML